MADTEQVRQEVETLKGDIRMLRKDLVDLVETVRSEGRKSAFNVSSRVREEAMNRISQLKDVLDNAKNYGQKAYSKAYRKLEDRPLIGVAAAFVAGAILGSILVRRRR